MDALPAGIEPALRRRAEAAAAWVREQGRAGRTVTVVHHIDADGLCSGAIALEALARAGVAAAPLAVKSLDGHHVAQVHAARPEALWFCDLGSTAYMHFPGVPRLVCDHHELARDGTEESFAHLNPLLDGIAGTTLSGAGASFLAAAALGAANADLRPLALVGAFADRQEPMAGTNALLLRDAEAAGQARQSVDLGFYGPNVRSAHKFLLHAEPPVPGLSGDPAGVRRLLAGSGAPADPDGPAWGRLDEEARRKVRTGVLRLLLDSGLAARADAVFRPVVALLGQPEGPLRDPREFGTLLNSTARYGNPACGLAVARGDRGAAYEEALGLLLDHRRHLVSALGALAATPVAEGAAVQHVHLQDRVRDTVVGIVAGMALSGGLGLRQDQPLVAFAWAGEGRTKVSARSPPGLVERGLDLSEALRSAAAGVGGHGGGHRGAAGATIPRGSEPAFVAALDAAVAAQLGVRAVQAAPPAAPLVPPRPAGPQRLITSW